ncbi:nucleophosmin [Gopherus flavomarginatus]|uniref:nucleophosmin n=1 Tax=Gopherus flavomarginatus TaxID=286002 RepID=UPI0021CC14B5|nr:nucleophosmin [Gopherus flavomarginatus]
MEDSMDMESMGPLRPQTFLFGCELKADKEYNFKVHDEENEHQLSLRTVSLGAGAKDELHVIEAEALDYEGNPIKVTLASLKMSVQPTVSLGGFEITPPVVLRLKCGSGPVHVSGQHLVALEEEPESDDEDEVKILNTSAKRPASGIAAKTPQKKAKLLIEDEEEEEEEDEDDDDEDEDEDDDDLDEEEEEKIPMKKPAQDLSAKNTPKSKQNGKDSKPSTPASKSKTPKSNKKEKPQSPKSPKVPLSLEEIKAKMQGTMEKGSSLPKVEAKFVNYVKNCFRTQDQKIIEALWQWRQTL